MRAEIKWTMLLALQLMHTLKQSHASDNEICHTGIVGGTNICHTGIFRSLKRVDEDRLRKYNQLQLQWHNSRAWIYNMWLWITTSLVEAQSSYVIIYQVTDGGKYSCFLISDTSFLCAFEFLQTNSIDGGH